MFQFKHFCLAAVACALPATAMADLSYYLGGGVGGARVERNDLSYNFKEYTTGTQPPSPSPSGDGFIDQTEFPYHTGTFEGPIGSVRNPQGTDFAFKVFGGVRFGNYFGAEVGYLNLGNATEGFNLELPAIFRLVLDPDTLFTNPPDPRPVLPGSPNNSACPPGSPPGSPFGCPVRGAGVRPLQNRLIDAETKIDGVQAYAVGYLPLGETVELFGKVGLLFWNQDTRIIDRVGSITPVDQPGIPEILLDSETPDGISFKSIVSSDSGIDLAAGAGVILRAAEHVSMRAELEWFDIQSTSLTWAGTMSLVFDF